MKNARPTPKRIDVNGVTYRVFSIDQIEQARLCTQPTLIHRICPDCGYALYDSIEHLESTPKSDGCSICVEQFLESLENEEARRAAAALAQQALRDYDDEQFAVRVPIDHAAQGIINIFE